MNEEQLERFHSTYVTDDSGCMVWTGATRGKGYGGFHLDGKPNYAHRISYTHFNGPIEQGLVIDHICRTRKCVNPAHLRAVTNRENLMAPGSLALVKRNAEATHCPLNHEYTPENIYWDKNGTKRRCATCKMAYQRNRTRKAKAA